MCFSLNADDALDVLYNEIVARGVVCWCKLLDNWTFGKSHVVLICRNNLMGVLLCRFLNHLEKRRWLFFAIDDEGAPEYLVAAVFGICLCEAKDFGIREFPPEAFLDAMQVVDFLGAQCQAFFLIVGFKIVNHANGCGLNVDVEDALIQTFIHSLKHRVIVGLFAFYRKVFFYTQNAAKIHVLCNLHGICTPRRHHFSAWADKETIQLFSIQEG